MNQILKQKVVAKLKGYKKEMFCKTDKDHQDSFWFDGDIVRFETETRRLDLYATGDIEIIKDGEIVYKNGQEYNDGINVKNDKDLRKIYDNEGYEMLMNNWFEFCISNKEIDKQVTNMDYVLEGDVDDVIAQAEELLFDDELFKNAGLK